MQKRCPKCGQVLDVNLMQCFSCGHFFRTHFGAPPNQTIIMPPIQGSPARRIWDRYQAAILLIAILAAITWAVSAMWTVKYPPILGTWRKGNHVVTFLADGTGEIKDPPKEGEFDELSITREKALQRYEPVPFRWKTKGNLLFIDRSDGRILDPFRFKISEDGLSLQFSADGFSYEMFKD